MNTSAQICTIKPRQVQDPVGVIEYQILDENGDIVSHGHQVPLPAETGMDTPLSLAQALVEQDCYIKGLLTPPDDWVNPNDTPEEEP